MTNADAGTIGGAPRGRMVCIALRALLTALMVLMAGGSSRADEKQWIFEIEPIYMQVYGHDQHVLTIHEISTTPAPTADEKDAVSLDTEDGFAYGLRFRRTGGQWGWGVDYFLLLTSQDTDARTAAADGVAGPIEEKAFEVAARSYTSTGPSEVLFYEVLEDTDLEVWTFDVYGIRTLSETPEGGMSMQLGLRLGDFDNDYRAVVGIQNVAGSRMDASSNYPLMMGPLVGVTGGFHGGRNSIEGSISQSLLLGTAELDSTTRDFTGAFGPSPTFIARESFNTDQDVAIPITEFRIRWTCKVGEHVSLGAGVNTAFWWDVSVPPGVIPIENGNDTLHENTIVFFGVLGSVTFAF